MLQRRFVCRRPSQGSRKTPTPDQRSKPLCAAVPSAASAFSGLVRRRVAWARPARRGGVRTSWARCTAIAGISVARLPAVIGLDPAQIRVLGCLLEKQQTTPDRRTR